MGQLDLFGDVPAAPPGVEAAPTDERLAALGARLPARVRLGTSSWSFPGWARLVYARPESQRRLARAGLAAYARHPLLRTVGLDRTHYAPIARQDFEHYAAQVPASFRMLAKAHELCTLSCFPGHARYGANRGQRNPAFLDAAYARDQVVEPFVAGLGASAGPLLFQLAPQPLETLGGPERFADRLHAFLAALPSGVLYAVEVRNRQLLTRRYADALAAVGAVHCINILPGMPPPLAQYNLTGGARAPALVIRWLLAGHLAYDDAKNTYHPFDAIVDPDPGARAAIATLVGDAERREIPSYVIVNNKAEGSAPLSVRALAEELTVARDVPF